MNSTEFLPVRKKLGKTHRQLAELLGSFLRAVIAMSKDGDQWQPLYR